ncbi:methionine/alanine import family NSS transporter small subunit [Microbacterium insulae]|uniref:Methionine/alanine import family NSS transporter small subunit n=1 Tax=Microbacterium insulae TaxID=483014 RepID=A0ABW3ALF5_9MICO
MTPIAIVFLVLSILIVWGGLIASVLFLRGRADVAEYPPGEADDHREDEAIAERDT